MKQNTRRGRNKTVSNDTQKAAINWNGSFKPVRIATGHIDSVSMADATEFAKEHDDEISRNVDEMAIHERGGDGIGYATVKDGEFIDYTIYSQYKR